MTKIRMFMIAALAVVVALGVCGQPAHAQELITNPYLHGAVIGRVPIEADAVPDAAAAQVHELTTSMDVLPPLDADNNPEWPCFGGGTDCASIATDGLVIGAPFYTWSLKTCTSSTYACGELTWTFETDVKSTTAAVSFLVTVTQGTTTKTTIYKSASLSGGTNPGTGYVEVWALPIAFGPGDCATGTCGTPVAGPATLTVVTTIGTQKATGTATITLSSTGGA